MKQQPSTAFLFCLFALIPITCITKNTMDKREEDSSSPKVRLWYNSSLDIFPQTAGDEFSGYEIDWGETGPEKSCLWKRSVSGKNWHEKNCLGMNCPASQNNANAWNYHQRPYEERGKGNWEELTIAECLPLLADYIHICKEFWYWKASDVHNEMESNKNSNEMNIAFLTLC